MVMYEDDVRMDDALWRMMMYDDEECMMAYDGALGCTLMMVLMHVRGCVL